MNKRINIKDIKECFIVIKEKDILHLDKKITKIRKAKDGAYCHFEYKEDSFIVLEDLAGLGKCFSTSLGEFFLKDYGKTWALTEEELTVTKLLNSKRVEVNIVDAKTDKDFVKQFREHNHLSTAALANILGVSKHAVENWECGVSNIKGSSAVLLKLLNDNPSLINQLYIVNHD